MTKIVLENGFQSSQELRAATSVGKSPTVESRLWFETRGELCELVLLTQEDLQSEATKKQEQVDSLDQSAQAKLEELAKVQAKKDLKQKSDVPKKSEKKSNTKSKRVCKTFNGIERCL